MLIAQPFDVIPELNLIPPVDLGINNGAEFVILLAIKYFDGTRRFRFTSGEWIREMGLKLRDMEDGVDPGESLWKTDGIGSSGRLLDNFVGSKMCFRELTCRTGSSNELGSDEYLISNFEDGVRFTLLIRNLLVTLCSICDLLTEVFMDRVNVVHVVMSRGFRNCNIGESN